VKAGGLVIEASTLARVGEHRDVWEKSVRKLRGRLMPPPGSRQPSQAEIDAVRHLDGRRARRPSRDRPSPGHVPMQRLTRTEFATQRSTICSASSSTRRSCCRRDRSPRLRQHRRGARRSRRRSSINTSPRARLARGWPWRSDAKVASAPTSSTAGDQPRTSTACRWARAAA
jgi:hypothetical protein